MSRGAAWQRPSPGWGTPSTARRAAPFASPTTLRGGEHHVTIPDHAPLRPGTLSALLRDIGAHANLSREELLLPISNSVPDPLLPGFHH